MTDEEKIFENEVRRIARQLWPQAEYSGSAMEDNRERDGVFRTEEAVHVIEATVSRGTGKAKEDINKISSLIQKFNKQNSDKSAIGWFVTKHEPEAEQRKLATSAKVKINVLSYDQFRSRLINAKEYLELRSKHPFGSIADPAAGGMGHALEYSPLDVAADNSKTTLSIAELAAKMRGTGKLCLLGDYGAGKSMTLRECYKRLTAAYHTGKTFRFPVLINLREHPSQDNPVEALSRHATNIGFPHASHLVRAWRAGYVNLFLDGFDEIARTGWMQETKKLHQLRYQSVALIRNFIQQTPEEASIALAGRLHYFDSLKELKSALGVEERFEILHLDQFTIEQARHFLKRNGWDAELPAWFPTRPLLLGYLASHGLLAKDLMLDLAASPAIGWERLLDQIAKREAASQSDVDGPTVRRILERLASISRRQSDGLALLTPDDIKDSFQSVCGYPPDDAAKLLLQRLPGLGATQQQDGSRHLIDTDFADAARAGDIVRFIEDPFANRPAEANGWECPLETLGIEIVAERLINTAGLAGKLSTAAVQANESSVLAFDVIRVVQAMGTGSPEGYVNIRGILIPHLELSADRKLGPNVIFEDCVITECYIEPGLGQEELPRFKNCHFAAVSGRVSRVDIPDGVLVGTCVVDDFGDSSDATAHIMDLRLPLSTRVILTLLKKIFLQKGSARRQSSLARGLDHNAKRLVPDLMRLLSQQGLVDEGKSREGAVWIPKRDHMHRVRQIIAAPSNSKDPLLELASKVN